MFEGVTFYWATCRKIVAAFGTLFNSISIERRDGTGALVQTLKVPLSFAPKHRYLARLREDTMNPQVQTTMPRLSFELTGFAYDAERQLNPLNYRSKKHDTDTDLLLRQMNPVPYNYGFNLGIYAKNMDDGLQILEQILPFFSPHFNVSIIDIPALNISRDVPIVLEGVTPDDPWEGGFQDSDHRILAWDLSFVAKGYMYAPIRDAKIIKNVFANLTRTEDASNVNPEDLLETLGLSINPQSAGIDDPYTIDQTITPGDNT